MADIHRGYYHSMDRDYNPERLMPIRDVGVSIIATKDAIEPLKAKIREGASKVEIGFLGAGKGSIFSGQITPESIDSEQRRAIRELSKVNKVELSTHATVATGGFAGFSGRGFDDSVRISNLNEIKRAIEFAADTAQGGAVTMHADEFPRPIFDVEKRKDVEFLAHPGEKEDATFYLVDSRTGDVIQSVRKNVPIHMPVFQKNPDGTLKRDAFENPMPEIQTITEHGVTRSQFKVKEMDWNAIVEETNARNKGKPEGEQLKPEQVYHELQVESRILQAKGDEFKQMREYDVLKDRRKRVIEALDKWRNLQDAAGPDKTELMKSFNDELPPDLVAPKRGLPVDILTREKELLDRHIASIEQTGVALRENILDYENQQKRLKPILDFAVEKSADSIARAGLYAYDVEKSKELTRPLFVAPEGLFPEKFGSHPQELKHLILKSREEMAKVLHDRGMSENEAQRVASDHIKATVDVGHVNVWKKYFQRNPGETLTQADERFNKWLLNEMEDLNKHKIIGHLHISDNFGYQDEHLTPGTGSAPIKDFVALMKKAGVTDMIVEPGAQDPAKQYEALYGGWKLFGHSIYGLSAPGQKQVSWGDFQMSYFGQQHPPYFLFGELALSEEYRGSPFWSGLGLE
ncbi:MAG TPA: TIM barrel protein [Candidatus Binatia bacterium]|nr:TIM barrel protein [Candidatus Binatia bacterium]